MHKTTGNLYILRVFRNMVRSREWKCQATKKSRLNLSSSLPDNSDRKTRKKSIRQAKKRGKRYVVGGVLRTQKCQFYSIRNSQTCSQTFNIPSFSKKICDLFGSEDFQKPEVRKIVFLAPPPLFPFQNEGGGYADSYLCDRSTYEQKKEAKEPACMRPNEVSGWGEKWKLFSNCLLFCLQATEGRNRLSSSFCP